MMTPKECRAKAAEALVRAAEMTDPTERAIYNAHAREWTALSMIAEVQSKLETDLIERSEDTDSNNG